SLLYPCAMAPAFSAAIRRFLSFASNSGGRPVLAAQRRLRCPPDVNVCCHRPTEVRLTLSRGHRNLVCQASIAAKTFLLQVRLGTLRGQRAGRFVGSRYLG